MRDVKTSMRLGMLVATILLMGGCSNKLGQGAVDAGPACAAWASARCAQIQKCNPYSFQATYGALMDSCVSINMGTCVQNLLVPGTSNTPALEASCAAEVPAETCQDYYLGNPPASCIAPAGAGGTGAPCGLNAQCASQVCLIPNNALCGTCQTQPAVGASCALTGCGRGLICDQDGGTCLSPAFSNGASCTDSFQCGVGFTCVAASGTGTCQMNSVAVGTYCNMQDGGVGCANSLADLFCDSKGTFTCQSYTWVGAGQPCGYLSAGVRAACASGGFCSNMDGGMGICAAPAADGAACDTVTGPNCAAPSRCVWNDSVGTAGTCQRPNPSACH